MDGKLKKLQITPAAYDSEGEIKKEEYALVTLEIPMDSTGQRNAIISLCELLDQEWVTAQITSRSTE